MKIEALSKKFNKVNVLDNFTLTLPEHGIIAFMGASGSGKTTLFNIISGILQPDSGTVIAKEPTAVIFQEDRLLPWINVSENVGIVLDKNQQGKGIESALLAEIGLSGTENQPIQDLSGGMRRRVAIVRALAYDAPVLLMDEPFKGLDFDTKKQVMNMIFEHSQNKLTLLITHDMNEVLYLADELYLMEGPPLRAKKHIEISENQSERRKSPKV